MDDVEDALLTGNSLELIRHLRDVEEPEDFRLLVDEALNLEDFSALWYIIEIGSRYDEDLDNYILEKCGTNGQTIPCDFFQNRDNAMTVLENAVLTGDEDLLLYAIDLLYSPLDPINFSGYSTQDYERSIAQSRLLDQEVEDILQQASPSFLKRVFSLLPERLRVNLILAL